MIIPAEELYSEEDDIWICFEEYFFEILNT